MQKLLVLITIFVIFFIFGTATSDDLNIVKYDCLVMHQGDNIVLISQSTIDISLAQLNILRMTPAGDFEGYSRLGYNLDGLATDTIPFSDFTRSANNDASFPDGEMPSSFSMEFSNQDTFYTKEHVF